MLPLPLTNQLLRRFLVLRTLVSTVQIYFYPKICKSSQLCLKIKTSAVTNQLVIEGPLFLLSKVDILPLIPKSESHATFVLKDQEVDAVTNQLEMKDSHAVDILPRGTPCFSSSDIRS